jgi:hypothetical protein
MWRNFFAAVTVAFLALTVMTPIALAEERSSTVAMQGQTIVTVGKDTTEIWLVSRSSDYPQWRLDMAISSQEPPVEPKQNAGRDGGEEQVKAVDSPAPNIKGSFTLETQVKVLSRGTLSGWLKPDLTGDFKLTDPGASTSLNMSFTITPTGIVIADLSGRWPALPTEAPVTPAQSAGSVPRQAQPQAIQDTVPVLTESYQTSAYDGVTNARTPSVVPPVNGQPADPSETPNHFYWYVSRTSALLAYMLLFLSICLGIGMKSKGLDSLWGRTLTFDLHQFASILGGGLVVLHVISLLGDSYFKFTIGDLLIPMVSAYRPFWTATGILGFYCGALLVFSFYIRRMIGQKTWRTVHYISYALFFIILLHGINTGTDTSLWWVQVLYVASGTAVAFLSLRRLAGYLQAEPREPIAARTSTGPICPTHPNRPDVIMPRQIVAPPPGVTARAR